MRRIEIRTEDEDDKMQIKKYRSELKEEGIRKYDLLTLSNTSLTLASDSPNHIVNNSGPLMEMKLAEHSEATAFARRVLPQPGGP